MIDTTRFIPSNEDMHKLIKAFASVHVDDLLDGIGPNRPDAPFFERVARMDSIDEEDYIEMADRFYKYINTQLPTIQHIAGYPPETDWSQALIVLKQKGEKAKAARLEREKILAQFERDRGDVRRLFMDAVKKLQDVSSKNAIDESHVKVLPDVNMISFATQLEELGMTSAEALAEVATWMRRYAKMILSGLIKQ